MVALGGDLDGGVVQGRAGALQPADSLARFRSLESAETELVSASTLVRISAKWVSARVRFSVMSFVTRRSRSASPFSCRCSSSVIALRLSEARVFDRPSSSCISDLVAKTSSAGGLLRRFFQSETPVFAMLRITSRLPKSIPVKTTGLVRSRGTGAAMSRPRCAPPAPPANQRGKKAGMTRFGAIRCDYRSDSRGAGGFVGLATKTRIVEVIR